MSRVTTTANYINIIVEPNRGIYEYEVRFQPCVDLKNIRFQLLKEHKNIIGNYHRTFDGTLLCLPFLLSEEVRIKIQMLIVVNLAIDKNIQNSYDTKNF